VVALVTGGGSGIGRATALALAERGARVALAGRRPAALEETLAAIRSRGGQGLVVPLDVRDQAQVQAALVALEGLRILVNCAGTALRASLADTSLERWREVIDTNLTGAYLCCRAAAPGMAARGGGVIVNVASTLGRRGQAGFAAYAASKFGLVGLTESLAGELAPAGIRVLAVCPGATDTALHRTSVGPVEASRAMKPERVAAVIVGLVTGEIALASGGSLVVDDASAPPASRLRRVAARLLRPLRRRRS
jgi:NAD(P)-dependent dehydrogenase (short-subunit alcohol dehydrogenase family)